MLAGGLGTRLRSVVPDRPKPMANVSGRPFLEHLMNYWIGQGIERFILSVSYRADLIQHHFGDSFGGVKVEYVVEPEPLGTGGALLLCQRTKQLQAPFLLLNGDTFFAVDAKSLQSLSLQGDADWTVCLFRSNDDHRYLALGLNSLGQISFGKPEDPRGGELHKWANGGVYWVHPRAINPFAGNTNFLSLESNLFPSCAELGQTFLGLCSEATFIDIGLPEDYIRAQTMHCFSRGI